MDLNAFPEYPDCMLCHDTGIMFGDERPFEWCKCIKGLGRRAVQPNLVDESNATRERLGIGL